MDPDEFWLFAACLGRFAAGVPAPQSVFRSAASRAYYAAFLVVRERLESVEGKSIPRERPHQAVIQMLNGGRPNAKTIGASLKNLRAKRNDADYNLGVTFGSADATFVIDTAAKLIDAVRKWPQNAQC